MTASKMLSDILSKNEISQKDLAGKLKVAPSQISRWINRETEPRRLALSKIEKVYAEMTA